MLQPHLMLHISDPFPVVPTARGWMGCVPRVQEEEQWKRPATRSTA